MCVGCDHIAWNVLFLLVQVKRQDERELITAVNELSTGAVSPLTVAFLKSLDRPLHVPRSQVLHLASLNDEVSIYNNEMLNQAPGKKVTFVADDTGKTHLLKKLQAPKVSSIICDYWTFRTTIVFVNIAVWCLSQN